MDHIIDHLRGKGRVAIRRIPGQGDCECIILTPATPLSPGVVAETFIPVEDFRLKFTTPASLKGASQNEGYYELARELEKEGVL